MCWALCLCLKSPTASSIYGKNGEKRPRTELFYGSSCHQKETTNPGNDSKPIDGLWSLPGFVSIVRSYCAALILCYIKNIASKGRPRRFPKGDRKALWSRPQARNLCSRQSNRFTRWQYHSRWLRTRPRTRSPSCTAKGRTMRMVSPATPSVVRVSPVFYRRKGWASAVSTPWGVMTSSVSPAKKRFFSSSCAPAPAGASFVTRAMYSRS